MNIIKPSELDMFINSYDSIATRSAYRDAINAFKDFLSGYEIESPDDIGLAMFNEYKRVLRRSKYKATSINARINPVKQFWKFLYARKRITNLEWKLIKNEAQTDRRRPVTDERDLSKLLFELPEETLTEINNKIMMLLFANTGLRLFELTNLTFSCLTWLRTEKTYEIVFIGKGAKRSLMALHPEISARIKALFEMQNKFYDANLGPNDFVIQNTSSNNFEPSIKPVSKQAIHGRMKRMTKRYGIDDLKPHALRRMFAEKLYRESKGDVGACSMMLRHVSEKTTREYLGDTIKREVSLENATKMY